jgi:hypothetical protein
VNAIPTWPGMMKRKTAAAYCDMTEAAFEREVFAGRLPMPVMFGGRDHWRKEAIDRALDHITGEASAHEPEFRRRLRERYAPQTA